MMDIMVGMVRGEIVRPSVSVSHSTRHWHQRRPLGNHSGLTYSSRFLTAFRTRSAHSKATRRPKRAQFARTTKSPNSPKGAASDWSHWTRKAGIRHDGLPIRAFPSVHAENMV